jgi:hypothetical protein
MLLHYRVNFFEVFQSPRFEKMKKKENHHISLSIHELKVGSQNIEGCSFYRYVDHLLL